MILTVLFLGQVDLLHEIDPEHPKTRCRVSPNKAKGRCFAHLSRVLEHFLEKKSETIKHFRFNSVIFSVLLLLSTTTATTATNS